jgi:hypothetical protein
MANAMIDFNELAVLPAGRPLMTRAFWMGTWSCRRVDWLGSAAHSINVSIVPIIFYVQI